MRHREYRFPCAHSATALTTHGRLEGRVVNISAMGAKLRLIEATPDDHRGAALPGPGDSVLLELGMNLPTLRAQVRWRSGGALGLRFDEAISPRTQAIVRRALGGPGQPAPTQKAQGWNLHLREMR